jgi:hypothetical protein
LVVRTVSLFTRNAAFKRTFVAALLYRPVDSTPFSEYVKREKQLASKALDLASSRPTPEIFEEIRKKIEYRNTVALDFMRKIAEGRHGNQKFFDDEKKILECSLKDILNVWADVSRVLDDGRNRRRANTNTKSNGEVIGGAVNDESYEEEGRKRFRLH